MAMSVGMTVLVVFLSVFLAVNIGLTIALCVWAYRLNKKQKVQAPAPEKPEEVKVAKPSPPKKVVAASTKTVATVVPRPLQTPTKAPEPPKPFPAAETPAKPAPSPPPPPIPTKVFKEPLVRTEPFVDDPRDVPLGPGFDQSTLAPPQAEPIILPTDLVWGAPAEEEEEEVVEQLIEHPAETDGSSDMTFRVVSYNVRCDKDAPPFSWLQRKKHVREAIIESNAQVLCLQEAKQKYAQDLVRALGGKWRVCGVARRKNDEGTQIAYDSSVFTYIDSSTWVFHDEGIRRCPPTTHCTELSYLGRRKCAHVRIFTHALLVHNATNAPFNVINTHFPLESFEQEICARQLGEFVEQRTDTSWPVIVCGDLNSHYEPDKPDTPLARLLQGVPGLQCAHDLKDFPTYYEGFDHDVMPPGKGSETVEHSHRLDYILSRIPEGFPVRVERGDILHPRYKGGDGELHRPSDHEMLTADFQITRSGNWM